MKFPDPAPPGTVKWDVHRSPTHLKIHEANVSVQSLVTEKVRYRFIGVVNGFKTIENITLIACDPQTEPISAAEATMRVAIICSQSLANKYVCLELARRNEVFAIFQPSSTKRSPATVLRSFPKRRHRYGIAHIVMRELAQPPLSLGWSADSRMASAQRDFFKDCEDEYARTVAHLVQPVDDINAPEFVVQLREYQPDVVVCSGGPIYRPPLIHASGLMVNYHTGISPFYNGSNTIWWAFANGHPHLCGGTLMVMNEAIDGGDVLAHHFTSVEPNDDPATLFCKAIQGGVKLFNEFLAHVGRGGKFCAVPQPRPFFYYQNYDWTAYQAVAVGRRSRAMQRAGHREPERVVRYWDRASQDEAVTAFHSQIINSVRHVS
jgi:methionyl-tRNA formyltransferase